MSILEWRANKELVLQADKLIKSELLTLMLETVTDSGPENDNLPRIGGGVSDGDRSYQLGRLDGANWVLRAFKSLGKFQAKPEMLSPTYDNPH